MDNIAKTIGERIRFLRKEKGMTQKELADKLYIKREVVNYYENGGRQPKTDDVIKMSEIFDVSTDYILLNKAAKKLNNQEIYKKIGLNDESIKILEYYKSRKDNINYRFCVSFINYLISNEWLFRFSMCLWNVALAAEIGNDNKYSRIKSVLSNDQEICKATFVLRCLNFFEEIMPNISEEFKTNRKFQEFLDNRIDYYEKYFMEKEVEVD